MKKSNTKEKELYRKNIIEMVESIENVEILKRIYELTEYLCIHKKKIKVGQVPTLILLRYF